MSRQAIRQLKRVVTYGRASGASRESQALAKEAAVRLLERSIQFGHGRLSVVRLSMAVQSGAVIPREHWIYCRQFAFASKDAVTQALFLEAAQAVSSCSEFHPFSH